MQTDCPGQRSERVRENAQVSVEGDLAVMSRSTPGGLENAAAQESAVRLVFAIAQ